MIKPTEIVEHVSNASSISSNNVIRQDRLVNVPIVSNKKVIAQMSIKCKMLSNKWNENAKIVAK